MAKYLIKETSDVGIRGKLDFDIGRLNINIVTMGKCDAFPCRSSVDPADLSGDNRTSEESGALRAHEMSRAFISLTYAFKSR
jgi:hypothetical protein